MERLLRTALVTALAAGALAAPAGAAGWHGYALYNARAPVENGSGTHVARLTSMVLPDAFKVRVNAAKTRLTFGPYAACHSTGVITPALVASTAASAGDVLAAQLTAGTTYGVGTRGPAAWRVAKYQGGALRAAYVGPTRLAGVWVVIRAATTPHGTCHIGGVRESLGFPLADAFATIRANGY